ncbi:hypothetical protein [Nocardia amikacinitolerans]|uniref:hypothetical protein n=1 Tax=Nocardia amikacinitolerans TaxID=756689 RepID=UPI00157C60C4|nr:hypothetical protein [Nocardia amikacinitolerans]
MPSLFALRSERPVFRYGVTALAVAAGAILLVVDAETHRLLPLYAIGVFIGFTLSQWGLVQHWRRQRGPGWAPRAALNGFGACLTAVAAVVLLGEKFTEGAWLLLAVSEATARALAAALRMRGEIVAVAAEIDPAATKRLSARWKEWDPGVPLTVPPSPHRSLIATLVGYVRKRSATGRDVTVLLAHVEARHWWHRPLHNPRGPVLAAALRARADAVIATLPVRVD